MRHVALVLHEDVAVGALHQVVVPEACDSVLDQVIALRNRIIVVGIYVILRYIGVIIEGTHIILRN